MKKDSFDNSKLVHFCTVACMAINPGLSVFNNLSFYTQKNAGSFLQCSVMTYFHF